MIENSSLALSALNPNAVSSQGQVQGASQNAPRSEQAQSVSRFDTDDSVSFSAEALEVASQDFGPPTNDVPIVD
ncbi:hypothetical protein APED_05750 [Acanthopleuribacter pedis]